MIFLLLFNFSAGAMSDLNRLAVDYILADQDDRPSCLLVEHRRLERLKILREIEFQMENLGDHPERLLLMDAPLFNRFFLAPGEYEDETVEIVATWEVPPALAAEIAQFGFGEIFLKLDGDSIFWQEKSKYFPAEVSFEFDLERMELVTRHQAYYADYCDPQRELQLIWYKNDEEKPNLTTAIVEALL